MRKVLLTGFLLALLAQNGYSQTTLAKWTFEGLPAEYGSNLGGTGSEFPLGPYAAEEGIYSGNAALASLTGAHADETTLWSGPSGNYTPKSLSSNHWTTGDYYEIKFSSANVSGIKLAVDVYGSNTGPKNFKVEYRIGTSGPFSTLATYTIDQSTSWIAKEADLSSYTLFDNQPVLYFRLTMTDDAAINGGTISGESASRIDNATITAVESTLPVSFASFTSTLLSGKIKLDWASAVESNTSYFSVEKSTDAKSWTAIDKVTAKGSNSSYSSVDPSPVTGTNYYRIAGVDFDSSVKYSPVISKEFAGRSVFALTPNPAVGGKTKITFAAPAATGTVVKLVDISGRTVSTAVVAAGTLQYDLDVSRLSSGIYIAVVAKGTEVLSSAKLLVP